MEDSHLSNLLSVNYIQVHKRVLCVLSRHHNIMCTRVYTQVVVQINPESFGVTPEKKYSLRQMTCEAALLLVVR
jgi:hypothetical protein